MATLEWAPIGTRPSPASPGYSPHRMSEYLAAAAQALNAPEVVVQRSAEARAKASNATADDVLKAWAGGESAPAGEPVAAAPEPAPSAASEPEPAAPEAAPPIADSDVVESPVEAVQPAASVATVVAPQPPEQVVAAPIGQRMRISGRAGALFGLMLGLAAVLFAAQWLLPRSTTLAAEDGSAAAVDVIGGWLIIGFGLLSAALGAIVAGLARMVTGWFGAGMRLISSNTATAMLGAVAGFLAGAVLGAIIVGSGTPNDLVEGVTTVSALGLVVWSSLGWAVAGWAIGSLVQAFGVPAGIQGDEADEATPVKRRLATAFGLPAVAAFVILVVVLPVAYVFIQYPTWAPLVAIFIAGSILGFAGLASSRPGMKITAGEFFIAAAGIAVVVIIVAAVLSIQGGGHGEEEGHSEGGEEEAAAVLVVT